MHAHIIGHLSPLVSAERLSRMKRVLAERTRYFTVLLEDLYQEHNASAVLRTCDALGIQDVHVIEGRNRFRANDEVALGAAQWLTCYRYGGEAAPIPKVYAGLRSRGYRIVATSPHAQGCTLPQFDVAKGPAAFIFGTEKDGLSAEAVDSADEWLRIPMYGFAESFNISVSAAVILSSVVEQLRQTDITWHLSEGETQEILSDWLKTSVSNSDKILERLLKS